jgi:hypothetical protein
MDFTSHEYLILTRAMAGIHLDSDAPLRMDLLRKLAKGERDALEEEVRWCGDGQEGDELRRRLQMLGGPR